MSQDMRKSIARSTIITGLFLLLVTLSCNEEDEPLAPIAGKWRGTMAEIKVKPFGIPIPFSREDESFDAEMEFRTDGTLIVNDGSQTRQGTWQLNGNKLVTDIDLSTEFIELSGNYTIESLTETTLIFYLEKKNHTLSDPDTGQSISGDIKAILHFTKIAAGS